MSHDLYPGEDVIDKLKARHSAVQADWETPVTVETLHETPVCRLFYLTIGEVASLSMFVITDGGAHKPPAAPFHALGDGFRRCFSAFEALQDRGDFAYIHRIDVLAGRRRRGIGSRLLSFATGRAGVTFGRDVFYALCANSYSMHDLDAFYNRLGFQSLPGTSIRYLRQCETTESPRQFGMVSAEGVLNASA